MSTGRDASRPALAAWSVVCDFDGTIATEDVTDSLLERFARPGWQELERAWRAGAIGSRDCMAAQIELLDCSRDELAAHVAGLAIDPAFEAFVAAVEGAGATLRIASDGLDHVIHAMLARPGLDHVPVCASRLVQRGERRWGLEFPHARRECRSGASTCKCAALVGRGATLVVGDGASDFCAAAHADLTFSKAALRDHCAARGIAHRPIADFAGALAAWRELGAPEAAARAEARAEAA